LLVASCSSTLPGASPRDMSAQQHEAEAAEHEAAARRHEAQYDPAAERPVEGTGPSDVSATDHESYNPSEVHLEKGSAHRRQAEAHRAAAAALEHFEQQECSKFAPDTRAACPLIGQVAGTEEVSGGVRLRLVEGVDAQAFLDHIECYLAHAATRGFEGVDPCPLYLRGVSVEGTEDGAILKADDEAVLAKLKARLAAHLKR